MCEDCMETALFVYTDKERHEMWGACYEMGFRVAWKGGTDGGPIDVRTPFSQMGAKQATLVDVLRWRASHQPLRRAHSFLESGKAEERFITYSELDWQARSIACWLQSMEV